MLDPPLAPKAPIAALMGLDDPTAVPLARFGESVKSSYYQTSQN
jgi:hypothetical protein